ncbi:MAG: hypothetical protein WBL37_07405 [Dehalococcoidales bacterium]
MILEVMDMVLAKKDPPQAVAVDEGDAAKSNSSRDISGISARLEELESRPRRGAVLHWLAFILSLVSLVILAMWVFGSQGAVPGVYVIGDIAIGVVFAVEFFTRSGFHWGRISYLRSRFFDFIAIVPAMALVGHGFPWQSVWLWIIFAARAIRVVDRLLGDGFFGRNVLALVEGFEEQITDRVLERIIARIQADMDKAGFSHGVAEALKKNKPSILQRVHAATPHEGLLPDLAHIAGLDKALERVEERTYDSVVEIVNSQEVDKAVRDSVNSVFFRMRAELGGNKWRKHLGIRF